MVDKIKSISCALNKRNKPQNHAAYDKRFYHINVYVDESTVKEIAKQDVDRDDPSVCKILQHHQRHELRNNDGELIMVKTRPNGKSAPLPRGASIYKSLIKAIYV